MPLNRPQQLTPQNQSISLGILFPFKETQTGGIFAPTRITLQSTRSNLTTLLTTPIRGRVMHNDLYSPLPQAIFENWDEIEQNQVDTQMKSVISKYIPEIVVTNIDYTFQQSTNTVDITVSYSIPSLGITNDTVNTTLNLQP